MCPVSYITPCIAVRVWILLALTSFHHAKSNMASLGVKENAILTKIILTTDSTKICVKGDMVPREVAPPRKNHTYKRYRYELYVPTYCC